MEAQRIALGAASENIANASTTRTADGTPYALKHAVSKTEDRRAERFSDLLSRMESGLQTSDSRHMGGLSLDSRTHDIELGPTTEVKTDVKLRPEFDPSHPDADAEGYVYYPDVNIVDEMARMMSANRIYEANLSAVQAAKEMIKRTLEI